MGCNFINLNETNNPLVLELGPLPDLSSFRCQRHSLGAGGTVSGVDWILDFGHPLIHPFSSPPLIPPRLTLEASPQGGQSRHWFSLRSSFFFLLASFFIHLSSFFQLSSPAVALSTSPYGFVDQRAEVGIAPLSLFNLARCRNSLLGWLKNRFD